MCATFYRGVRVIDIWREREDNCWVGDKSVFFEKIPGFSALFPRFPRGQSQKILYIGSGRGPSFIPTGSVMVHINRVIPLVLLWATWLRLQRYSHHPTHIFLLTSWFLIGLGLHHILLWIFGSLNPLVNVARRTILTLFGNVPKHGTVVGLYSKFLRIYQPLTLWLTTLVD